MSFVGSILGFEIIGHDEAESMRNQAAWQMANQMAACNALSPAWPPAEWFRPYVRQWNDEERARRLKQFDLDRASFRRA